MSETNGETTGLEIAVIGMACRFPGASSVEAYWQNLLSGTESISSPSDAELEAAGVPPAVRNHPAFVRAGGILDRIDEFDAQFFGFTPREAEILDPQQRLFLECASEALERAGYDPRAHAGAIGVYAGSTQSTYLAQALKSPEIRRDVSGLQILLATDKDFLASRVAYKLDLEGPAVVVQTACSTSLVAVHLACQSLLAGECDMALAGGSTVKVPHRAGYLYEEEGIHSSDGHCRPFDARANGTVPGNGVGIVALKRLKDAIEEGAPILAVIKGSAINNDGASKVGYAAPRVEGEARAIRAALAAAGVAPETVSAIEAHGTATALGDPIEVRGLNQVFSGSKRGSLALGSVKGNIGHLDAAAGVAGLMKMVLCLHHRMLVPSLHFETPNAEIDFDAGPFYVNTEARAWKSEGAPRRGGVSSFGIGGTNAHVVLEEAPPIEPSPKPAREREILVLSAKTPSALARACDNLADHLEAISDGDLADVAHTLGVGRRGFPHRLAVVVRDRNDAVEKLRSRSGADVFQGTAASSEPPVIFLFSGQGAQHVDMARGIYEAEPEFRAHLDACSRELAPHLGCDLREELYPAPSERQASSERLTETWLTQPALFAVEYSLARFWMGLGIQPKAMIGHSIGELVAATVAGVFDREDALALVAARGRLMQAALPGAMVSVPLAEDEASKLLRPGLALAAVNAPEQSVLAGSFESVEELERRLARSGVEGIRLRTSHAFHSEMMEVAARAFESEVARFELGEPRIPFVSNSTGRFIRSEEARSPSYWGRHLRETVRFSEGIEELLRAEDAIFLEVGPGRALSGLVRMHGDAGRSKVVVASLQGSPASSGDAAEPLSAISKLWAAGAPVDWKAFRSRERRRRVCLPTYPFERQRFWVDSREPASRLAAAKHPKVSDWLYLPSWKRSMPPVLEHQALAEGTWLVFRDRRGLGAECVEKLSEYGARVTVVDPGRGFRRRQDGAYEVRPGNASDYGALLDALSAGRTLPSRTLHLWGVGPEEGSEASQDLGFFSLLALAQALGNESSAWSHRVVVVTSGMEEIGPEELRYPEKATVLGPVRVIPQEYPGIRCRSIDVLEPKGEGGRWEKALLERLLAECLVDDDDAVIAYRGNHRWIETFEPVAIEPPSAAHDVFRDQGLYVVTGGLGGIGLAIAGHLARERKAKLVLVSRSGLPDRAEWSRLLDAGGEEDETAARIRRVRALEDEGAEVVIVAGDVADRVRMEEIFQEAESRFGRIQGIIHAAGVAGSGLIQLKSRERAEAVLAPKIAGTRVLVDLARAHGVGFLFLCSSLASTLGGTGQVDYCAANSFQDAVATRASSRSDVRVVSVDWDTWAEAGMAVSPLLPELQRREARRLGITSSEGVEVLRRVLASRAERVLVSARDLASRVARARRANLEPAVSAATARPTLHPRPSLQSEFAPPRTELERDLAEVWQGVLGIAPVGIADNFFELGGDSVSALRFIHRMKGSAHGSDVPLRLVTLYEAPTIEALARRLVRSEEGESGLEIASARAQSRAEAMRRRRGESR